MIGETIQSWNLSDQALTDSPKVARLYIAYPNRSRWTYTGLQGAAVLANDLVGNTYWLKLVDVSVRRPLTRALWGLENEQY